MDIKQENKLDLLDTKSPALSSTNDMPVIETKPDATNEGKPPAKPESEVKAAPDEGKTTGESATPPAEPAADDLPAKPAKGVQKRLDELTKREADAVRRAEALQAMLDRELAAKQQPKVEPQKPVETNEEEAPARPSKADFPDPEAYDAAMDAYIEARATWVAEKKVNERLDAQKQEAEQRQVEEGQRAVREAYSVRAEKALEKYPDYKAVAESPDVQVSMPMAHAILHSEHGPEIAYFFGKNPAEAQRISKLNPVMQLVEIGRVEARLSAQAPVAETKPPITQAPKPIKPLQAGSESSNKDPENESMDEYAARRKKELASERRPGVRH